MGILFQKNQNQCILPILLESWKHIQDYLITSGSSPIPPLFLFLQKVNFHKYCLIIMKGKDPNVKVKGLGDLSCALPKDLEKMSSPLRSQLLHPGNSRNTCLTWLQLPVSQTWFQVGTGFEEYDARHCGSTVASSMEANSHNHSEPPQFLYL